ncbi:MAG: hypothetical protein ABEL51_14350 [Salinibacter sp.]
MNYCYWLHRGLGVKRWTLTSGRVMTIDGRRLGTINATNSLTD